ncbi:precorrin-6A/cobalt-precorrin-6A reductase [Corynebacterium sp. TAE3-ERU12]|nr:precorrin-6A/cobalt-precorrin-6A reductase [Corynebacterium sp. TAE3-ERU12]MBV7295482.1 precorrin-6A/cobalt-precorrin-6A reductase [Corynebacterium sp. TAE3-ERU12]
MRPGALPPRALIIGGTDDARDLARRLQADGWLVTTALSDEAGDAALPVGQVRIGGFGGAAGMARWLLESQTDVIVDAAVPLAQRISDTAAEAARATGVPLVVLLRPEWEPERLDKWIPVDCLAAAADVVRDRFRAPLLDVGPQSVADFASDTQGRYLIRANHRPSGPLPSTYTVVPDSTERDVASERKLMRDYAVDCVVVTNTGSAAGAVTLEAARNLKKTVVMVQRPALPGASIADVAHDVGTAQRLLRRVAWTR